MRLQTLACMQTIEVQHRIGSYSIPMGPSLDRICEKARYVKIFNGENR